MRRSTALTAALVIASFLLTPATGDAGVAISGSRRSADVHGTLETVDPLGCGSRASVGCDEHPFSVTAPAGAWVTVRLKDVQDPLVLLRVRTADGQAVGESGGTLDTHDTDHGGEPADNVTFRQVRAGRVAYVMGVSSATPTYAAAPWSYTATVSLSGTAWDRAENCAGAEPQVVPPIPANTAKRLRLSVLVLTPPALLAEVRRSSAVIATDYAKINIAVRLTVRSASLPASGDPAVTFAYLRKQFGGERPRGYDVVYAASDYFPGGVASCIGGVQWPERAFALGEVHYTAQGHDVPNAVRMGDIAAHEIGHLLGARHEFSNCAEAEPEAVQAGAQGPCTIMSPAALTGSGEWSTLETAYVRYYVEHYAKG
ncbi:MAG: hypothetical protein QOE45_3061 [Frankiaceae bacterium]|jgi:hypothetical protein|nr:hypothetical protein [Frankiaceae bacterium]